MELGRKQVPVGVITEIHGPVTVIACDSLPPLHQALCANVDNETYLFEVHQHLDKRHIRAIILHKTSSLHRGSPFMIPGLLFMFRSRRIVSVVCSISLVSHWMAGAT